MTSISFERIYREAISSLRKDHAIGQVYSAGGKRFCLLDGSPVDDDTVLAIAFGREIAASIRNALICGSEDHNTAMSRVE